MIRFSAVLVAVAIGVLIGGVTTSKLTLVYVAIAVSAVALITLAIGVVLKREELFGEGQALAPAGAGGSPVLPAPGQPVSAGDGADRVHEDPMHQNGPAAPPVVPFPEPAVPAYGLAAFGATAYGQPAPGQSRDRERRAPWEDAGRNAQQDQGRQANPFSGWQAGTPGSAPGAPGGAGVPGGTDTAGYGTSRDNAGRPPLSGRHSRNAGTDGPWSPFAPAESGSSPESSSPPFSSTPRRVPGATLGSRGSSGSSWFDQDGEPARPAQSAGGQDGKSAATTPGDLAGGDAAASGDEDDDWPTRYSWLEDAETDKADDRDGKPSDADKPATTTATPVASEPAEPGEVADASAADLAGGTGESVAGGTGESVASGTGGSAVSDAARDPEGKPGTDGAPGTHDEPGTDDTGDEPSAAEMPGGARLVTVVPGVPRYHNANCILIRFMAETDVKSLTIPEARNLKCTPCAACQPED